MDPIPKQQLKLLYNDLLKGFSTIFHDIYGAIYLKHFTTFDLGDVDLKYDFYYQKAIKEGLPTRKEKEEYLIKEGFWTQEKNNSIHDYQVYLDNLKITKSKFFKSSDIHNVNREIGIYEKKIDKLKDEKDNLIQFTAEGFASKKINEFYIYISFFKNKELDTYLFRQDDFDELNDNDLVFLVSLYNERAEVYNDYNLKRISLSPFFFNFFSLSESAFEFYGKAVVNLTFYQSELYGDGRYFKNLLSNCKTRPSDELMDNPTKLIEWYESSQTVQEVLNKGDKPQDASSLMGLTQEDREKLGMKENDKNVNNDLVKAAVAKGESLSMNEILKIMGK